jgi:hypothetical protein
MTAQKESTHPPRVFLSHASEDSERFARGLATRLRERGVKVWFAEWELLPGDSLVDRIFEEGLSDAEAVIIVVSQNSVNKPWVREELNAAVVRKIERQCKLIPVVIDDCEVPAALRSTVWLRIRDLEGYEAELDRLIKAIFGSRLRPALGAAPAYALVQPIDGLDSTDTRVLQVACEVILEKDSDLVDTAVVLSSVETEGITEEHLIESLEVLEGHGFLQLHRTLGNGLSSVGSFQVNAFGMDEYARHFMEDYERTVLTVAALLVNDQSRTSDVSLAEVVEKPRQLIEFILELFEGRGLVRLSRLTGPVTFVDWISPQLKRQLQ